MTQISNLSANWNYPTAMRCGSGRIKELADTCRELGMKKPLLVTDPGIAKLPMVNEILRDNKAKGMLTGIFQDIKPNPTCKNVDDGLKVYRENSYDGVIAFGGGSALDAAKAIALVSGQTRPLWDFEDIGDNWVRVNPDGVAPIIAVPTTAGTGSEVGRASVIVQEETHSKKIIFHPQMLPSVVISDPELTIGLPAPITAATGMDALSHCLEALCAPGYHPMADGIAVEGIRLIAEWLPIAVDDGSNLEARYHMLVAASMGATAFQKGLGAMHSLAHPIGAIYDVHHGLTNAVLMPYVLEYNKSAIEDRMTRLAAYLGFENPSFEAIMKWVLALKERFEIPVGLDGLGIDASKADEIAEKAALDPTAPTNAIPLTVANMKTIFMSALNT
jgi:alcohol dehydrogenase class IV